MEREELKPTASSAIKEAARIAFSMPVTDPNYSLFYHLVQSLILQDNRIKQLENLVSRLNSENSMHRPLK